MAGVVKTRTASELQPTMGTRRSQCAYHAATKGPRIQHYLRFRCLVFFAAVIVIPYHFYRTRRARGFLVTDGVFALWLAPSVVATLLRPALRLAPSVVATLLRPALAR